MPCRSNLQVHAQLFFVRLHINLALLLLPFFIARFDCSFVGQCEHKKKAQQQQQQQQRKMNCPKYMYSIMNASSAALADHANALR